MTSLFNVLHKPAKKNLEGGDESDQFQTPWYALPMVARYIPLGSYLWEPACGKRNIVKFFFNIGYHIHATDYLAGEAYNFFRYTPPSIRWDYIVTNPPWSLKIEWTLRCLELGKPFALLVPLTYLEDKGTRLVDEYKMEIIKPYQRIAYETPHEGWWSHYDKPDGVSSCKYKQSDQFDVCPKCGGTDKIKQIKSSPQKQSIWITWGFNIGSPIVYYDMRADKLYYKGLGNGTNNHPAN